jgi:site-specific DNA recombinase
MRMKFSVHTTALGSESTNDRGLVERHVDRIIVRARAIDIHLLTELDDADSEQGRDTDAKGTAQTIISVPWTAAISEAVKGILHSPTSNRTMTSGSRNTLLKAIAKSRCWVSDLVEGRVASFAEIAEREGKVERHVRFLAPLAFVSPRITSAIIDGSVPAELTVTDLAKSLPYSWIEQERRLGLLHV